MFKDGARATLGISRAALLASMMLIISLALSIWSWQIIDRQRQREASARFDLQQDRIIRAIENRMLAYRNILEGAQGLFAASQQVSRREFQPYVKKLELQDRYPGIQGIGYSEFIKPARLASHLDRVREEGFVRLFAQRLGEPGTRAKWKFFVEDNGIGFDMKYLTRIFAPFQRLHSREAFEGTGIGLTICHKIVARHGGEPGACSTPGEGATFMFTVPENQADARVNAAATGAAASAQVAA